MDYVMLGEILATEVTPIVIGLFIGIKIWKARKTENGRYNRTTRKISQG